MISISIICPIFNEEKYIENCIKSIINQDFSLEEIELILVDGISNDSTRNIIQKYIQKYSFIRLLDNPERSVSYALNIGIKNSKGNYIARIDAHAVFPKNYLSTLYKYSQDLDADNIGCLINTLPANSSTQAEAISFALSSSFGMGSSLFRVGTNKIQEVDTVPFGFFKKDIFEKIGLFDTDLIRNQDDEFNGRIIKSGGKIFLIPEISIDYYPRDSLKKTYNMFYQYGLYKPLVNKKLGSPATIRQFFPLLFVIGLFVGFLLSLTHQLFFIFYLIAILLYLSLSVFFSFKSYKKFKKISLFIYQPITYFIIHYAYGWGYLTGIKNIILRKRSIVKINR